MAFSSCCVPSFFFPQESFKEAGRHKRSDLRTETDLRSGCEVGLWVLRMWKHSSERTDGIEDSDAPRNNFRKHWLEHEIIIAVHQSNVEIAVPTSKFFEVQCCVDACEATSENGYTRVHLVYDTLAFHEFLKNQIKVNLSKPKLILNPDGENSEFCAESNHTTSQDNALHHAHSLQHPNAAYPKPHRHE
jgi:hypothetical protein